MRFKNLKPECKDAGVVLSNITLEQAVMVVRTADWMGMKMDAIEDTAAPEAVQIRDKFNAVRGGPKATIGFTIADDGTVGKTEPERGTRVDGEGWGASLRKRQK